MFNRFRFFCQRVLPLVYDDSLSYMELLYKVVHKINELIPAVNELTDNLEEIVNEILTEWKDDGTLELIIEQAILKYMKYYYIPEDFGGVGDGVTDCTDAFDAACKAMDTGDIKALYIPAGKTYLIKNTIALPAGSLLFGSGEKSRIYWDETVRTYGVGITAGGDDVSIVNLRIDQANTGTVTLESATGSVGFGTLDVIGKVDADLSGYGLKSKRNIYVHKLWCNGRYAMQVETRSGTPYTMSNIVVDGLYAPIANVSFMAREGLITDLHYTNIECDFIRAGAAGTEEYGNNIVVDNFKCRGARLYTKGAIMRDGYIDCSALTNNTQTHAIALKTGTVLENVKIKGGNEQYTAALSLTNKDEGNFYTLNNCVISGFDSFCQNANLPIQPIHINNCNISWNTSSRPIIKGTVKGSQMQAFAPRTSIFFEDKVTNISQNVLAWTLNNWSDTRFPVRQFDKGGTAYIKCARILDDLPEDNVVFNIASDYLERYNNEGQIIPCVLYSADFEKSTVSTIYISNGQGILRTTGLTISDYRILYIDSNFELSPY